MTDSRRERPLALDAVGAMKLGSGVSFDPYRACLGLASAARRRGARPSSNVHRSRKSGVGRKQVDIIVDGGIVQAETVIVTTGVATAEFKPLRRHFKRRETYLVLTEPLPPRCGNSWAPTTVTIRDMASPRHRLRRTKDGRLLIAGADRDESPARQRDALRVQRTGQLMYELLMMYPAISGLQPEYGWEMAYGETADGLMYIGPHRNYPRHLFALGSSGDSRGRRVSRRTHPGARRSRRAGQGRRGVRLDAMTIVSPLICWPSDRTLTTSRSASAASSPSMPRSVIAWVCAI